MSDEITSEQLPDTLTAKTGPTGPFSEGPTHLPPIWGQLVRRRCFLATVELRNFSYKLGRSASCDIHISFGNTPRKILNLTSKEHFIISRDKTNIPYIKDLSKNGTFVNSALIGRNKVAQLRNGDIISIGEKPHQIYTFKEEFSAFIGPEFDENYTITRLLGRGAFGEVYLAISKKSSERVAVKKIQIACRNESKITNEVRIMNNLKHPCVIRMFEAINTSQHVYILMEFMEGGELQGRVLKKGQLRENTAKLYAYQMAIAVEYLHNCGITHRDLKPENILLKTLKKTTILKITDFGMSKYIQHHSVMQTLCGTPLYVAPEILKLRLISSSINSSTSSVNPQTSSITSYTPQVDVWSLGCILFFMLFGQTPFHVSPDLQEHQEDPLHQLYQKIIHGDYKIPVRTVRTGDNRLVEQYPITDEAVEMIKSMLETDPAKRITISEVLEHEWFHDQELEMKIARLFD